MAVEKLTSTKQQLSEPRATRLLVVARSHVSQDGGSARVEICRLYNTEDMIWFQNPCQSQARFLSRQPPLRG